MSRCTYHLLVDLLFSAVSARQTDRQDQLANNRLCLTVFLDDMGPFSFLSTTILQKELQK